MRSAVLRSAARMATVIGVAALAALARPSVVLAHDGEDKSLSHVLLDVGVWSLGAVAVLGLLVAVLWLRARRRGLDT